MIGIRDVREADAGELARICNHYIEHSVATFEECPVFGAEMASRMEWVHGQGGVWLVLEGPQGLLGYAYGGLWQARSAYCFTAEVTVYLDARATGAGRGAALYTQLIPRLAASGFYSLVAGISLPNGASVALHERCGFHKVAHFVQAGWKFGHWVDVGYWQRALA